MRNHTGRYALCGLAVAVVLVSPRCAAHHGRTPGPGSPARQQVLDALRPAVERELGQAVRINVEEFRGNDRWAFVTAVPTSPDGRRIDYSGTGFAAEWDAGELDDWLCALLELRDGTWDVVALEIGATDVPFADWPERFGVPRGIVMP